MLIHEKYKEVKTRQYKILKDRENLDGYIKFLWYSIPDITHRRILYSSNFKLSFEDINITNLHNYEISESIDDLSLVLLYERILNYLDINSKDKEELKKALGIIKLYYENYINEFDL